MPTPLSTVILAGLSRENQILGVELHPDRHVIRRFLASSDARVDPALLEQVGGLRRQQVMIDADAIVSIIGAGLIVPKAVVSATRMSRSKRFGEPQVQDLAKCRAGLRARQRIIFPGL